MFLSTLLARWVMQEYGLPSFKRKNSRASCPLALGNQTFLLTLHPQRNSQTPLKRIRGYATDDPNRSKLFSGTSFSSFCSFFNRTHTLHFILFFNRSQTVLKYSAKHSIPTWTKPYNMDMFMSSKWMLYETSMQMALQLEWYVFFSFWSTLENTWYAAIFAKGQEEQILRSCLHRSNEELQTSKSKRKISETGVIGGTMGEGRITRVSRILCPFILTAPPLPTPTHPSLPI